MAVRHRRDTVELGRPVRPAQHALRRARRSALPNNGQPERTIVDSHEAFRALLPNLGDDRAAHHLEAIGFAVPNEIKHRDNPEFVINEVQTERADYDSEEEFITEGNSDSAEAWAVLADAARALALRENKAAS